MSPRRELSPRGDFAHVAVVRGSRGVVVEVDARPAAPCPRLQLDGVQVRDIMRADDLEALAAHPAGIRRVLFGGEFFCELFRDDRVSCHEMLLHPTKWRRIAALVFKIDLRCFGAGPARHRTATDPSPALGGLLDLSREVP